MEVGPKMRLKAMHFIIIKWSNQLDEAQQEDHRKGWNV